METRSTRNAIGASINELARFIRKTAPVTFGEVCLKMHVAPSTLYGWKKILLDTCSDIHFSNGTFNVEKHHRMPDGALVPTETKGSR
jgi:hypothetical protein